ncbi:MAG: hypothetical protein KDA72_01320 [Planctomycetales bacterium]|nr:hypothetical protein [Planctomycetales bacterium]
MSRISIGRVGALLSRRCKQLQRKSQQRIYRKLFWHRPGMEGLEPRLMLARDLLVADLATDSILRFDGDTGAPLGAFVTSGSGGLVDPLDPEFGPDGNLYVISTAPGQAKVLRYNGSSGAPLGTFVDLGAGGASAIEFGPDGNLYLATVSDAGVLRFNGTTGQPMGVAAGGNGIRRASGISFGPDGKLYVLDSDSVIDVSADRVLRFDPSNGAFIDQFVAPGQLNDAVFLTFGPDNQIYVPDIQQFHDVRRFSGATGKFIGVFTNSPDPANNPIFDIQFAQDGNAYAATGKEILRLDGETGRLLDTFVDAAGGSMTFFPPEGASTDLSVTSVQIPVGVVQGNDLSVTYTVTNNSVSATTVNSWDDVVYLSTDDVFDPNDIEFGRIPRTVGLAGGANYSETLTAPLPSVSLGDYHVFVFADRRGVVNDTARLNNLGRSSSTLEVFPPLASSHDPDNSIAVGRTLSAYTTADITDNQLTITYTVYNLTNGYAQGTLLTTTLGPDIAVVSASILPDRNGQKLAWSLGTLAPFGSSSVELTVSFASSLVTQVDNGPQAFATLDTVAVRDDLSSAVLRTDVIDPALLTATPDANSNDPFIQAKAAELNQDAGEIFQFLIEEIGFESYAGSLRGARGTLWSRAGNSIDEASLGVALMRASGIPAQYAEGTISNVMSKKLISSMFSTSLSGIGLIPSTAEKSDPENDPQLLSYASRHFWFQFNVGLGFQNADTTFADAKIGDSFANADAFISELPDVLRHKVTIRVNRELTSPGLFGTIQSNDAVVNEAFSTVELVGKSLNLGHLVYQQTLGFGPIGAITNKYVPYLQILDEAASIENATLIQGVEYQDIVTTFPFSSQVVTGVFLEVEITGPDLPLEKYSRTIADRIGIDIRENGGTPNINISPSSPPLFSPFDSISILATGGLANPAGANRLIQSLESAAKETVRGSSEIQRDSRDLNRDILLVNAHAMASNYLATSDAITRRAIEGTRVVAYFDRPRVVAVMQTLSSDNESKLVSKLDLVRIDIRSVAQKGQNMEAEQAFQLIRGIFETSIEGGITSPILSGTDVGIDDTTRIFDAAQQQGIDFAVIEGNSLTSLDGLEISIEAKLRITSSALAGKLIIVPTRNVTLNGTDTIAWLEYDPTNSSLIGIRADGSHGIVSFVAAHKIAITAALTAIVLGGLPISAVISSGLIARSYGLCRLDTPVQKNDPCVIKLVDAKFAAFNTFKTLDSILKVGELGTNSADIFISSLKMFLAVQKYRPLLPNDPVIPESIVDATIPRESNAIADAANKVIPSGVVIGNSLSKQIVLRDSIDASWNSAAGTIVVNATHFIAGVASVFDDQNNLVGTGDVGITAEGGLPISISGNAAFRISGHGMLSFYDGTQDLRFASAWTEFNVTTSGESFYEVTASTLVLNGSALPEGSYRIVSSSAALSGSDSQFTSIVDGNVTLVVDGDIALGPSAGELSIGQESTGLANGVTLQGFSGTAIVSKSIDANAVQLNGVAEGAIFVTSNREAVTTDQNSPISFQVNVNSSNTGPSTMLVDVPKDWRVQIENNLITVTPANGTSPGDYVVRFIGQANEAPSLTASAEAIVTITPVAPDVSLEVEHQPLYYIAANGAQVRTAFEATVQNLGPEVDSFDIELSSAPTGFRLESSVSNLLIPAGESVVIGIYLVPDGPPPLPGSDGSFQVTVRSTSEPSVIDTQTVAFTVPEIHGISLENKTTSRSTLPGISVTTELEISSRGNVPETVSLTVSSTPGLVVSLPSVVTLAAGEIRTVIVTMTPDATTPLNSAFLPVITASFGNEDPVTAALKLRVAAPGASAAANTAEIARNFLGNLELADRMQDLSISLTNLAQNSASEIFKRQAVSSLDSIISLLSQVDFLDQFVGQLMASRDTLIETQTQAEVQSAILGIGTVLDDLSQTAISFSQYNFELFLLPNSQVALPQTPTQFELRVHNIGTNTSTYNFALQGVPAGVSAELSEQQMTLDRDGFASVMVTLTQDSADELLEFGFTVDVSVDGASQISKSANGSLTARKEFVSVVSVTATPPFTEAGGTLDVSTRLLNAVNREQKARASFVIRDASGATVGTASTPVDVTLTVQTSLVTLPLGSINTTGLANGSYSILMTLVDMDGQTIPGGTGSTTFLVGSPLTASVDVAPGVLPPGTNNVTNTLKIKALAPLVSPPALIGQSVAAGASDVVRNGDIVYVASPAGIRVFDIAGANLQDPQLLRTVGSATTLLEQRGNLLVSVLSRPGGGSTALTMYSLTDPANPTQVGTTGDIPYGTAADLIVTDTHAFIVLINLVFTLNRDIIDQNGGLIAINISDPANPFFDGDAVSARGTPAGWDGVNDGVLFNDNGTNNDGIKTPLGIDQSGGNQNTWSVVQVSPTILLLSGSTATGTDTQSGVGVVRVVDISDPRNMRLVRDLPIPGTVHVLDVAVSGNRALLTASQGGIADLTQNFPFTGNVVLATLDISDPANPLIIHQQTLDRAARGVDHVTTISSSLYAISNLGGASDKPGLFIVDASDPNNLGIGGIDVPAGINELIGGDGLIFTTDGASLIVYQVPPSSPLTLVGQVPVSGGLRGVAARGEIAYASGSAGIQIIDYSDPANPVDVGTIPGNHLGARIQDNVLLALRPSGVGFILDVFALQDTPLAPPLIGSSPVINYNLQSDLKSDSSHAYVTQFQTCFFLGSQDIYFQGGDLISIALNLDDVANPTAAAPALNSVLFNTNGDALPDPKDVSGCAQNGGDNHVTNMELVNASTAYLATTTATGGNTQAGIGRVAVVDISDTTSPSVIANLDIPGTVEAIGIGVSGNVGVVIGSTGGFADNPQGILLGNLTVTTLDVSDPRDPKIITTRTLDRGSETFWSNFVDLGNGIFGFSNLGYHDGQANPAVVIIDASNPRSPLIGQASIPAELIAPNSLSTDGKFLFTADGGGVSIYTVNPLPGLPVTARVQIPNGTGVAVIPGSFNIPPAEVISGTDFDTYIFDLTLAPSLPSEILTWQSVVVGLQPGESRPVTLGTSIDFAFQGTAGQVALPRTVVAAEQVLSLDPAHQIVRPGGEADFNVKFTNPAPVDVTYDLSVGGVPSQWVGIDASVTVPAGGTVSKVLRLTTGAFDVIGDYGFVINAIVDDVKTSVAGTLVLAGVPILPEAKPESQGVVVTLTPTSAIAGQGTAATYTARLTNVGSQADSFVLSAAGLPSGFQARFALDSVNVPPGASNFREVLLTIIPPQGTDAGDYPFIVTATSASEASIADDATSTLSVLDIGVAVEVTPESGPPESTYQMLVTNIGQVRETFDLSLAAPAALMATLGVSSVTLEPGQSTSVPIDVGAIDFAFPGSLSLVGVATSRSNPLIRAADGVGVDIAGLLAMTATFD